MHEAWLKSQIMHYWLAGHSVSFQQTASVILSETNFTNYTLVNSDCSCWWWRHEPQVRTGAHLNVAGVFCSTKKWPHHAGP